MSDERVDRPSLPGSSRPKSPGQPDAPRTPRRPKPGAAAPVGPVRRNLAPSPPGSRPGPSSRARADGPLRSGPGPLAERRVAVREADEGTDLAADGRVAIIVDALRASATLCALFDAGAAEVIVAVEPEACLALAASRPGSVTLGERGGRTIKGFDLGNSPSAILARDLRGRTIAMTTTNGALRICACAEAPAVFIGGPRNMSAVVTAAAEAARARNADVVVIAVGASEGAAGLAAEDLASASLIAERLEALGAARDPGGGLRFPENALPDLFRNCPNGRRLKELGFAADVPLCAEVDRSRAVPRVVEWLDLPGGDVAAVLRASG